MRSSTAEAALPQARVGQQQHPTQHQGVVPLPEALVGFAAVSSGSRLAPDLLQTPHGSHPPHPLATQHTNEEKVTLRLILFVSTERVFPEPGPSLVRLCGTPE